MGRTLFLKRCLSCSSFFQDCGNTACMFCNLVYSHMMIFYDPGCSHRIFFYGLVCVCIILDVLLWSCMFLYVILPCSMISCLCMFLYIHLQSCMFLYVLIWCSCVFLYVLLWSYMIFYDFIYSVLFLFVFYDSIYSMMFFRCFSMIMYAIVCAYDYLLWWCVFLYSSMILCVFVCVYMIFCNLACYMSVYILYVTFLYAFTCPYICFYMFLSELSTFPHHDL